MYTRVFTTGVLIALLFVISGPMSPAASPVAEATYIKSDQDAPDHDLGDGISLG